MFDIKISNDRSKKQLSKKQNVPVNVASLGLPFILITMLNADTKISLNEY